MHNSPALPVLLFIALYIGILFRLAWLDFRYLLLPDKLTYPLLWTGLLFHACFVPEQLAGSVFGAIGGYLSLWVLHRIYYLCRKREGIGYGDMKLLAALGAWHGWQSLGWITVSAAIAGLVLAMITKIIHKRDFALTTTPLPFGPNLAIAGGSVGWIYSSFPQFNELSSLL